MLGIEVPAEDENAGQRQQEKKKAEPQPKIPPEVCQIEHRRKDGGDGEEQSSPRRGGHFYQYDLILHI